MVEVSFIRTLWLNFLKKSPDWFKFTLVLFLITNPLIFSINSFIAGWLLVIEFIFTLAMALRCNPLLSGGLLSLEAVMIGMTTPEHVYNELTSNLDVILLLVFMVTGVCLIKELLILIFTKLLLNIKDKKILSLIFYLTTVFLSAFLDALTVITVIISISVSFYEIYYNHILNTNQISNYMQNSKKYTKEISISHNHEEVLKKFCGFLRSLIMHAAIGTALGGVMTMIGEPQNLIIAREAGWNFSEFSLRILPVSLPVFFCGTFTCWLLEKFSFFGYGEQLPVQVNVVLQEFYDKNILDKIKKQDKARLLIQGIIGIWLILALMFHLAEVGLIGLSVIILATSLTGISDEQNIRKAFTEAVPFTALLTAFFVVTAVILDQQLFKPIIESILNKSSLSTQLSLFYLFNGIFSSISDNVFVGTIYINEVSNALKNNVIDTQQFRLLAVAINAGTNLPSVATPNGQAAFLFLLTSTVAPLVRISYRRMVLMAMPYTIVLTLVGLLCIEILLLPITKWLIQTGIIIN